MEDAKKLWGVWQGSVIVCANLTKRQAAAKVANEHRIGNNMEMKPARPVAAKPRMIWLTEDEDD